MSSTQRHCDGTGDAYLRPLRSSLEPCVPQSWVSHILAGAPLWHTQQCGSARVLRRQRMILDLAEHPQLAEKTCLSRSPSRTLPRTSRPPRSAVGWKGTSHGAYPRGPTINSFLPRPISAVVWGDLPSAVSEARPFHARAGLRAPQSAGKTGIAELGPHRLRAKVRTPAFTTAGWKHDRLSPSEHRNSADEGAQEIVCSKSVELTTTVTVARAGFLFQ